MTFVTTATLKRGQINKHVVSVHGSKKLFKCDICYNGMKGIVELVHERKKPLKCDICDKGFH